MELLRNKRKELVGKVTSSKRDKTVTIMIEKKEKHPLYGKFMKRSKKFQVHDEKNECQEGDIIKVMETRPLSKTKRFRLVEILEKAK
jgi:small subunit ribosomal protein S17